MKIVHLVTSTAGGAAKAAIRLHESLIESNCHSRIFSVERRIRDSVSEIVEKQSIGALARIASSATTVVQRKVIQRTANPVSPISLDLLNWDDPEIESADVLHLHAFYNLVSIRSFLTKYPNKKKVVTLHDERFLTGGCHYRMGCEQLENGCKSCPQVRIPFRPLVARQRKSVNQLIHGDLDVTFICPSVWLMDQAMKAFPEFSRSRFIQIYNPIPKSSAVVATKSTHRPGINFGFVSQSLENPLKDLSLLLEAFESVNEIAPGRYSLTLVGESDKNYSVSNPNISQKTATSLAELQKVFSAIDVLVVPSRQDNLPNVLGEALMCGVGLIGSNAGGIPEVVELFNQSLFENGDREGLVQALRDYEISDRSYLQEQANNVFGYHVIAPKLMEVYSSLLR